MFEGFSWKTHSLSALLKSPLNFEPVLKGAVAAVSFFHPFATVFWGVLGTNLVSGAPDPLVSIEAGSFLTFQSNPASSSVAPSRNI